MEEVTAYFSVLVVNAVGVVIGIVECFEFGEELFFLATMRRVHCAAGIADGLEGRGQV